MYAPYCRLNYISSSSHCVPAAGLRVLLSLVDYYLRYHLCRVIEGQFPHLCLKTSDFLWACHERYGLVDEHLARFTVGTEYRGILIGERPGVLCLMVLRDIGRWDKYACLSAQA